MPTAKSTDYIPRDYCTIAQCPHCGDKADLSRLLRPPCSDNPYAEIRLFECTGCEKPVVLEVG